jgi:oligosaccharide reducing-end xylanase
MRGSAFVAMIVVCGVAVGQRRDHGHGAFATRTYRDLFAERGHAAAETQAKIERAYQQLFHGDPQTEAVYFEKGSNADGPLGYVTDWAHHDVRTEGMSYGMMIAVQMGHKQEFDAIWNWAKTYMLITDGKNPNVGYFAWSLKTDGTPLADGPADDGEEYFVMALYFADHRWGPGKGIYDYKGEADRLLRLMRHHPVVERTGPFRVHAGDAAVAAGGVREMGSGPMVEEEHTMIRFVPDYVPMATVEVGANDTRGRGNVQASQMTDASYQVPHFYELWARWGPKEDRRFWAKAAKTSRRYFPAVAGAKTGLTPERSGFDASPVVGWDGKAVGFGYDSWRSVSNWSVDSAWFGKSAEEPVLSERYQGFLAGQGMATFADQYTLEGKPMSEQHSAGMVAAAAAGGLALGEDRNADAFVEALWGLAVPRGEGRYYDGMLYLMSLLHCSGRFRIW